MRREQTGGTPEQASGELGGQPGSRPGGQRNEDILGLRGSRSLSRDLNASLLIELVRRFGPISRAELSRQSQISAPTVSAIVAQMLARGTFSEVAVAPSSGGRPPVLLQLNPTAGYVVGIKLRSDGLTTVVCDLDAGVVATDEASVALVGDPAAAITAVEEATRRVLQGAGIARTKVLGVGIGLPGVIDSLRGSCQFSHLLQWHEVELAAPLQRRLRLPVWVDNDVNTLAIAEKWAGDGIAARNFITLSVGRGLGLGIVIDRAVYRGAVGGAGEFGHLIVDPDGPECECGRSGCLEALVGERALLRRVSDLHGRELSRDDFISLAAAGDGATIQVLTDASELLGVAMANVVTLLNPELVIICGEGTQLGAPFLDSVVAAIRDQPFAGLGKQIEVKVQQWGDDAWAVGAATLVLRESFALPGPDEDRRAIWHRLEA
ncbi:MAG TPA: ROK family protein [Streptosporangiaceae bacterium]|nr:ROK family protein [Streptosporangiaceae bacterium]